MFVGVKRRSIQDFKPKIVLTKPKSRSIVKSLPSSLYTSTECLKLIKCHVCTQIEFSNSTLQNLLLIWLFYNTDLKTHLILSILKVAIS